MLLYHGQSTNLFFVRGGLLWTKSVMTMCLGLLVWTLIFRASQNAYAWVRPNAEWCEKHGRDMSNCGAYGDLSELWTSSMCHDAADGSGLRICPILDKMCITSVDPASNLYNPPNAQSATDGYKGVSLIGYLIFATSIWLLNFRMNNAWSRYWQGITHLSITFTKWTDCFNHLCSFIDITLEQPCEKEVRKSLIQAKREVVHLFSLMSAVASDRLLSGDLVLTKKLEQKKKRFESGIVSREKLWQIERSEMPELDVIPLDQFGDHQSTGASAMGNSRGTALERGVTMDLAGSMKTLDDILWHGGMLRILDPLTEREHSWLDGNCLDRPSVLCKWIIDVFNRTQPLLVVGPPIVSRIHGELNSAAENLTQSFKLADIPCYFAHAQAQLWTFIIYIVMPLVFQFILNDPDRPKHCYEFQEMDDTKRNWYRWLFWPLLPVLYIAILGTVLWAMLRMALSLENPFGSELQESNKVPVLDLHEKFLEKLVEIYFAPKITDSIPKPYKNAVKKASPKSFRRSDSNIELMKKSRENYSMKRSMSKSRLSFTRRSLTMEAKSGDASRRSGISVDSSRPSVCSRATSFQREDTSSDLGSRPNFDFAIPINVIDTSRRPSFSMRMISGMKEKMADLRRASLENIR